MISDVFSREASLAESRWDRYSPETSASTTREQQQQQSNTFPTLASTQSVRQEDGRVLPGRSVMSPGGEAVTMRKQQKRKEVRWAKSRRSCMKTL